MMNAWRGVHLAVSVALVAILLATSAVAVAKKPSKNPTGSSKYYVTYKVKGSFSDQALGQSCSICNANIIYTANWNFQERFGPVNLDKSAKNVRASAPVVSGSYAYNHDPTPGPEAEPNCDVTGSMLSGPNGVMNVVELHLPGGTGFDGVALGISDGQTGPGAGQPSSPCGNSNFFGPECGLSVVRTDLSGGGGGQCSTANFFATNLSVPDSKLRTHHFTYNVSNSRSGSETVDKYCNDPPPWQQGFTRSCSYSWSGTVTLRPTG